MAGCLNQEYLLCATTHQIFSYWSHQSYDHQAIKPLIQYSLKHNNSHLHFTLHGPPSFDSQCFQTSLTNKLTDVHI